MRSETAKKILSETPESIKQEVREYADLKIENSRLNSDIREFKLLCRAYFAAKSVAHFGDGKQVAEAVLKEAEFERRILSELEEFTRKDVDQLPFKD